MSNEKYRVAIGKGDRRGDAAIRSLSEVREELRDAIRKSQRIVLKPNLVDISRRDACTDISIIDSLLNSFPELLDRNLRIAEGSSSGSTHEGYKSLGYTDFCADHDIELIDVNSDDSRAIRIYDRKRDAFSVRASKTLLDSDLRISLTPAKTHDTVVITLSLKNCCVGSLVGGDKQLIHQGYQMINLNLALLAKRLHPHFSLIDAFSPMQGDGPVYGECTHRGLAISGMNSIAVDSAASRIMGFDPREVGYLFYSEEMGIGSLRPEDSNLLGDVEEADDCPPLKPHSTFESQIKWKFEDDFPFEVLGIDRTS